MHLLYCDETNFKKVSGDFFVYGGITIDAAQASDLSKDIEAVRTELGVSRGYLLKFNPGPANLSHAQFIALKKGVIAAAIKHDCKLLVNLLLHDIATSSEDARRMCINTLSFHFHCFLNRKKVGGLVLIDRFDDKEIDGQLKEKLAIGLTGQLPYSTELKLNNILGYHLSAIGQSHFCSLVDVILGSLRFAVNAFTRKEEQHMNTSRSIIQQLAPMFFREANDEKVSQISFWFSPKQIRSARYLEQYRLLKAYLAENGVTIAQSL